MIAVFFQIICQKLRYSQIFQQVIGFYFLTDFEISNFLTDAILLLEKKPIQLISDFLFQHIKISVLLNLKYMTVT